MKIEGLKQIQVALTALSRKPSTLGYLWAKNLNLVKGIITKADEDLNAAKAPLYEKDEEGKDVNFVGKFIEGVPQMQGMIEIVMDENGERRKLKPDERLYFPYTTATMIAKDNLDKLTEIQKQYNEENHEVNWHKIPEAKFIEVATKEMIEGELILPIDGIIIEATK